MECSNTNWIVCRLSKPQWVADQWHWVYSANPRSGALSWVPPPPDNIDDCSSNEGGNIDPKARSTGDGTIFDHLPSS